MTLGDGGVTREQVFERMTRDDGPFAVDAVRIHGVQYNVFRHAPPGLHALFRSSLRHGDAVFLVFENERYSFSETYRRAAAIAQRLVRDHHIRKGDRVAIAMRNYPEWCFSYMAITSIGAVAVALNAWWQGDELAYGLKDSHAKLVFADQERFDRLWSVLDGTEAKIVVARPARSLPQGVEDLSGWLQGELPEAMPSVEVTPDDDAALYYTSGTAGYPKGALSTHRAIISAIMSWRFGVIAHLMLVSEPEVRQLFEDWLDKGKEALATHPLPLPRTSALLALPLFHVTGCNTVFLFCASVGRKLVMMRRWTAERALQLIEAEKITNIQGVPTQSWELVNSPDFEKRDVGSLLTVGAGGSARPPEHLRRIVNRLPNVFASTGYGLTETNALGTSIAGEDYIARPTSVGRALQPLCEIKIVDEAGSPLGPGQDGEICLKSIANIRSYWNRPEDTAATIQDGWVRTGDIGHLDHEGFLYITDRAKDIIVRGGENVSCTEVENALCEHPAVFEAAVFGVPDERLGEAVWAEVMVNPHWDPDTGGVDGQVLKDHLAGRLAAFKVPSHIRLRHDPLPRGATEKIDKRRVRSEALQER